MDNAYNAGKKLLCGSYTEYTPSGKGNFVKTLHSNLVLFKFYHFFIIILHYLLYIPIWFYSNDLVKLLDEYFTFFTFQSGSIQISYKTAYSFTQ